MRMQLCLYISCLFCNENNKTTSDPILRNTLHPSEMLPESLRRMLPNTELPEDCPRWKRKAGQSEARQYTTLAKLAKDAYNSGLTWKLHHLRPEKKSLYKPSMVWTELRGQKRNFAVRANWLWQSRFLILCWASAEWETHRSSDSGFLVELETDKGKEGEDSGLVE